MSDVNAWDGRPQNPERAGIHALAHDAIWGGSMWWSPKTGRWIPPGSSATFTADALVKCYPGVRYLGPCATPGEVAALTAEIDAAQAEARANDSAGREAVCGFMNACSDLAASQATVRDLVAALRLADHAFSTISASNGATRKAQDAMRAALARAEAAP